MSRKPVNAKSGLDRLAVLNSESATHYIKTCEGSAGTVAFKAGVYARSVNDNGWTCPRAIDDIKTQGLIKSVTWTVHTLRRRAESGDAEAQVIIKNIESIIKALAE
jgi:hypothetical protein